MSDLVLEKFLDQIPSVPSIQVVVFTGGEATLHLDALKKGLFRAKEQGKITRVVSNGWWAKSPDHALRFLDDLQQAGLDEINH